eukprot:1762561-Amphidinium_carterae.2
MGSRELSCKRAAVAEKCSSSVFSPGTFSNAKKENMTPQSRSTFWQRGCKPYLQGPPLNQRRFFAPSSGSRSATALASFPLRGGGMPTTIRSNPSFLGGGLAAISRQSAARVWPSFKLLGTSVQYDGLLASSGHLFSGLNLHSALLRVGSSKEVTVVASCTHSAVCACRVLPSSTMRTEWHAALRLGTPSAPERCLPVSSWYFFCTACNKSLSTGS